MEKGRLPPDSAREAAEITPESTRILRRHSIGTRHIDASKQEKKKKYSPKRVQKKTPANPSPLRTISFSIPDESTGIRSLSEESTESLQLTVSDKSLTSQETARRNLLTVISKSLSGLRLRQNLVLLGQIHPDFKAYAFAISSSALLADKLLAFRTSGPSFNAIKSTLLPSLETEINALFLIRWMVMRLYAFGHPGLITSLGTIKTPEDVLKVREAYKESTGLGVNSLPVYGNVRFDPKRIPGHLNQLFADAPKLFASISEARQRKGGAILFKEAMELIGKATIPYYRSGSIFQWLLVCDLAELDVIVAPPTARDLAMKIECFVIEKKGGSGAWNGLVKGLEEQDWPEVTIDGLTNYLEWIYNNVKECLGTQGILFRHKGFWYSDLEHCLCKVIRSEKY